MKKQVLLFDMDGVVADFRKYILDNSTITAAEFDSATEEVSHRVDQFCITNPTIFEHLQPIEGAIETVTKLFEYYDIYFCSTPMYLVPESYKSKRIWLEKHFGELASRRLILTHRKDLIKGDILIDDRRVNGAENFDGLFIHFGTETDFDFKLLLEYLISLYEIEKALIIFNNYPTAKKRLKKHEDILMSYHEKHLEIRKKFFRYFNNA